MHPTMPTVLREGGYRFFFNMADRLEPAHIHVERDDSDAKVWLDPLKFSFVEGFREHECNETLRITAPTATSLCGRGTLRLEA